MSELKTECVLIAWIRLIKSILIGGSLLLLISACGSGGGSGGSSSDQDPLLAEEPIAYVKRPVPTDDDDNIESEDITDPVVFNAGGRLFVRARASQTADEINITDRIYGADADYDVKDVEVSYDGRKLVFSMRAPQLDGVDEEDQPKWNLWEYDLDSDTLALVFDEIRSGEEHDISPAYLPDGRIVFTSTRQVRSRSILLDEGKSGFAATANDDNAIFNLHIIDPLNDPNGTNIQQITFSQGHDLQPTVLSDGRIAFLRWDRLDNRDRLSLYTINSDGGNLRILYGYHSQETGNTSGNQTTFIDIRERSDGSLSGILQERDSDTLGGDIIQIDIENYSDLNQTYYVQTPSSTEAQSTLTVGTVNLDGGISTHGYFNSAYPVDDQRFLVSWNFCRLQDPDTEVILACSPTNLANPNLQEAPPFYGIWLYDVNSNTQTPVVIAQEGEMYTDVVLMKEEALPSVANTVIDDEMAEDGVGVLNIRSVYETDASDTSTAGIGVLADPVQTNATARPARFLRVIKAVSIPSEDVYDFDNSAFGVSAARGMREILGYTPIEPDGSVRAEVPADVAFYFDVVNEDGERIAPLHRNLLQVKAGEVYNCIGCHTANSEITHGRLDDLNDMNSNNDEAIDLSINLGALSVGRHFQNTQYSNVPDVEDRDTMAEVYAKTPINPPPNPHVPVGNRRLTTGLIYSDIWTDSSLSTVNAEYNRLYQGDLSFAGLITPAPVSTGCQDNWQPSCRTVINYPDHIQPLWEAPRATNACTSCHSRDDGMGNLQQPAGQLELTNLPSAAEANHFISYRELLEEGTPQILHPDGNSFLPLFVLDIIDEVQQFYLDANGVQILDEDGNPIPEVRTFSPGDDNPADIYIQSFTGTTVDVYQNMGVDILDAGGNPIEVMVAIDPSNIPPPPVMRVSNAAGSSFFDKLEGSAGTVDHSSFMSPNELRLLREWLDIGGQYYNNPLDAPLN